MHLAVPELVFTFFWQACIGFVFFVGSFALSGAEQKFACSRAFTKIYPGVLPGLGIIDTLAADNE